MIYTASYFAPAHHHGELISISNTEPKGFKIDRKLRSLVPPLAIVNGLKSGTLSWGEYERAYRIKLYREWGRTAAPRFLEKFIADRDCTLLCWEKDSGRCHRSILARNMRSWGYAVEIR